MGAGSSGVCGDGGACRLHICSDENLPDSGGPNSCNAAGLPSRCVTVRPAERGDRLEREYEVDIGRPGHSIPGSSPFSTSYKAVHRTSKSKRVIRAIMKHDCGRDGLRAELELLKSIDHPNINSVVEVWEDRRCVYMVSEPVNGGNLLLAGEGPQPLSESRVAVLLRQILLGLQQLHSRHLCHGGLRPETVLFTSLEMAESVKLVNFGLAEKYALSPRPVTIPRIQNTAPERLRAAPGSPLPLPESSGDFWSLGVIGYVLLSGRWPFEAENALELREKIQKGCWSFEPSDLWANVSSDAKNFISALLRSDPTQRLDASSALAHPFMQTDALSKESIRPLPRYKEIARALRRQEALCRILSVTVGSAAEGLNAQQILGLGRLLETFDVSGDSKVCLTDLRCGLVRAGVLLPANALDALSVLELDIPLPGNSAEFAAGGKAVTCVDYKEALQAMQGRRQRLEEDVLWSAWRISLPEGTLSVGRSDLVRMLAKSYRALMDVFGGTAVDIARTQVEDRIDFDGLLEVLRKACEHNAQGSWSWQVSSKPPALKLPLETHNVPSK